MLFLEVTTLYYQVYQCVRTMFDSTISLILMMLLPNLVRSLSQHELAAFLAEGDKSICTMVLYGLEHKWIGVFKKPDVCTVQYTVSHYKVNSVHI